MNRNPADLPLAAALLLRSSKRITITLPHATFATLEQRSSQEGRSLSNLAAYLLESSLEQPRRSHLQQDAA